MNKKIVIIGAGGHAREVLDIVESCVEHGQNIETLGYVVDEKYGVPGTIINDKPILGGFDWLEKHSKEVSVICGVGNSDLRYQLVARAEAHGCDFYTAIHPNSVLTKRINIGEGSVIAAGCILTNNITIGNHVHVNLDCTIGHDSRLMDFVTLSPGVHVSGNVSLNQGCYVGTGANIIEKLIIGEWSIVGAGAAVIRDVEPNTTVVGVPAKIIEERGKGWHLIGEIS